MVMDIEPAGTENMAVMEPENRDMVSIILGVEAGPGDKEIYENENNVFETNIPEDIKLQEHLEESGQLLDDHHHTHQGGQQVGDTEGERHDGDSDGDGEGAGGGRDEHGVCDELSSTKASTTLQLVRRKYRLKAGVRRDG